MGANGDWTIDFPIRYDFPHALRLCGLIEPLNPLGAEDLVRSENPEVYRTLGPQARGPIAVGAHFGERRHANVLVENQLMDYSRATLPNADGISEFMKLVGLCETHFVGLVPYLTGPVAEASIVHCLAASSGSALMELLGRGELKLPHLPQCSDAEGHDSVRTPNRGSASCSIG